jgi:hypothetical protein
MRDGVNKNAVANDTKSATTMAAGEGFALAAARVHGGYNAPPASSPQALYRSPLRALTVSLIPLRLLS